MRKIQVLAHGLHQEETADTVINRQQGLACYTFVRFHSPMKVYSSQGMVMARPGNCILLAPEFRHYYCGASGAWSNDWMYIAGDDVGACVEEYGIALNSVMAPERTHFVTPTFDEIAYEEKHRFTGAEEVVELLMRRLLLLLGREIKRSAVSLSPTEAAHLERLSTLRQKLSEQVAKPWSVKEMALQVGLSPSRFSALYQQFFGISPIEDLLCLRLYYAQHLLTNQAITISEVAHQCGFKNANHFSALFHQRIGCAPRNYYQYVVGSTRDSQSSSSL